MMLDSGTLDRPIVRSPERGNHAKHATRSSPSACFSWIGIVNAWLGPPCGADGRSAADLIDLLPSSRVAYTPPASRGMASSVRATTSSPLRGPSSFSRLLAAESRLELGVSVDMPRATRHCRHCSLSGCSAAHSDSCSVSSSRSRSDDINAGVRSSSALPSTDAALKASTQRWRPTLRSHESTAASSHRCASRACAHGDENIGRHATAGGGRS
mmetsp:Transcript_44157/g.116581  ORF Transcript_44157/g.116581 Transcript_44157/m.116581 type:complete len:213 (-) Transcript_44157:9-647(-)